MTQSAIKLVVRSKSEYGERLLERIDLMPTRMTDQTVSSEPIHACRLIVASNRGPVEYQLSHDRTLKPRRGAGGVVTALIDAACRMKTTWVAMAMTKGDRIAVKEAKQKDGYCVANQAIADAVNAEIDREGSSVVVMLHDYQLYLAAAMIRECHPLVVIQQFIHIPWPDVRCWHFLPSNITQAIYSGLAGNDIIGFQTERDARNFIEGARTLLDGAVVDFEEGTIEWKGHCTRVRAYPVSISVTSERRAVRSLAGKQAAGRIVPLLSEKTIMRVDRIEPTKNIVRGFQAYAQMLDDHPELLGQVTFLAFLVPSRQSLPVYKRYSAEVQKVIGEINQKYGSDQWKPIQLFYENNRLQALAAMRFYDVLLVNPIVDGMNLVAKEGPVVNEHNGVLVLSRTVGAFQQLGKFSIPTSPTDTAETAQALYKALTLPLEERRIKATFARQMVERHDLNNWLKRQTHDINELLDAASIPAERPAAALPALVGTAV